MNHALFRMASKLYNTPHLITPSEFNLVLDYIDQRNSTGIRGDAGESEDDSVEDSVTEDGIGLLRVDGSLTYKPVTTVCGEVGTSYKSLVERVEAMVDAGIKTLVMECSSGGGEASHVFQAADEIRAICDTNQIKLIGYADTRACSAAYALLCICDVVVANPSAELGSIGCVVALLDTSQAMAQAGLKRIFISSGESKVPFAEDGSFKKEFLEDIQAEVDTLNQEFAEHVSKHTGIDAKNIMAMQAKVFNAQNALKLGLCDAVMTNKEFAQYVALAHQGNS